MLMVWLYLFAGWKIGTAVNDLAAWNCWAGVTDKVAFYWHTRCKPRSQANKSGSVGHGFFCLVVNLFAWQIAPDHINIVIAFEGETQLLCHALASQIIQGCRPTGDMSTRLNILTERPCTSNT